jgi:histidine triad (HIT) family protein
MIYDKNNIFAKIIRGEIPTEKLYEDEQVIAIKDAYPIAPIHILVIPKGEYISFDDFIARASSEEIGHFYKVVHRVCSELNLNENGYRILSNVGAHGMQTIFHMHLHILAGEKLCNLDKNHLR